MSLVRRLWILLFVLHMYGSEVWAAEKEIDLGLTDLSLGRFDYRSSIPKTAQIHIKSNGVDRTYFVYSPKPAGTHLPVLVALHGAGRTGASMIGTWKPLADKNGFMVIAPNGTNGTWALQDSETVHILRLIQHELSQRRNQTTEIYLFGHSAGAVQALVLAAMKPNHFRRVAGHAGTLPLDPVPARPLVTYKTPIAIFLGDNDALFSVESGRKTVRWLDSLGIDSTLFILRRHGHWYYADSDKINESIWNWLAN